MYSAWSSISSLAILRMVASSAEEIERSAEETAKRQSSSASFSARDAMPPNSRVTRKFSTPPKRIAWVFAICTTMTA